MFKTCFIDLLIDQLIGNPVRSSSCELGTVQSVRWYSAARWTDAYVSAYGVLTNLVFAEIRSLSTSAGPGQTC